MFNVRRITMQNIKEWKLLELQITQTRHLLILAIDRKNVLVPDPKNEKKITKCIQNKRCTS